MTISRTADLHVGRGRVAVTVPAPAHVDVVRKPVTAALDDPAAAVARALDRPVGCAPLTTLATAAASACIVVCDVTRPVPNGLLLRPIIERLTAGGVPLGAITVLVATGLHRPNLGAELRSVIGDDWVLEHVRVRNHDARDADSNVHVGDSALRGTPVDLDRAFAAADLRIVTGLVEPHFMAGYSGGRKLVAPGVAGERTIGVLHATRFMADPLAATAIIDDNPLHDELLAITALVAPVFAVNTVIDEARQLAFVNAGEIGASHAEAITFARTCSEVPCDEPYDLIVTSAGGHPLDATYYQTIKAMVTPLEALAPDGDLVVVSACSEGFGSAAFRDAQRRLVELGRDAFLAALRTKARADIDEWQTQMLLRATDRGRVHLVSDGLSAADEAFTGVQICHDLTGFIDARVRQHPAARVAVIPEGPYVVPRRAWPSVGSSRGPNGPIR